jgi:hypothetical protein
MSKIIKTCVTCKNGLGIALMDGPNCAYKTYDGLDQEPYRLACRIHRSIPKFMAVLLGYCGKSGRWHEEREKHDVTLSLGEAGDNRV